MAIDERAFAQSLADLVMLGVEAEREACAKIAENGCLVPPDGGSPTPEEKEMCDGIARAIRGRSVVGDAR